MKLLLVLSLLGLADSTYLSLEHYSGIPPACGGIFSDCGAVLTSSYSEIFGVPLALLGVFHYTLLSLLLFLTIFQKKEVLKKYIFLQTAMGIMFSGYLVWLQLGVLNAICIYCMASALISTAIFLLIVFSFEREKVFFSSLVTGVIYKNMFKPILFLIDAEVVHNFFLGLGEIFGNIGFKKKIYSFLLSVKDPALKQKIEGINFDSPLGLAAGFDYEARLTQILPSLGFGFGTAGTITNMSYKGNPKPRLGRLPKSKSLMVYKGFKSSGANEAIKRLSKLKFDFPVGLSIGRTNSRRLKTQKQSVEDVVSAFKKFENSNVENAYYELNISCPNLFGDISFYPPRNLDALVGEIEKLKIKRPVFVKMPIEKSDREVLAMLKVLEKYKFIKGVIFGNLQKDRNHPSFDKAEVKRFKKGNFSGRPTKERSNELIELAYKNYKDRFTIIGCGGVFSAKDAYEKIKKGASLIQFITGMIFEGPQVVAQINLGLIELLQRDGYRKIDQAIGKDVQIRP